jgi:hypothetical protein
MPTYSVDVHLIAVGGVAYNNYFGTSNNAFYSPAWVFSKVGFRRNNTVPNIKMQHAHVYSCTFLMVISHLVTADQAYAAYTISKLNMPRSSWADLVSALAAEFNNSTQTIVCVGLSCFADLQLADL